jgi:hypothetical protein
MAICDNLRHREQRRGPLKTRGGGCHGDPPDGIFLVMILLYAETPRIRKAASCTAVVRDMNQNTFSPT